MPGIISDNFGSMFCLVQLQVGKTDHKEQLQLILASLLRIMIVFYERMCSLSRLIGNNFVQFWLNIDFALSKTASGKFMWMLKQRSCICFLAQLGSFVLQ